MKKAQRKFLDDLKEEEIGLAYVGYTDDDGYMKVYCVTDHKPEEPGSVNYLKTKNPDKMEEYLTELNTVLAWVG